ncbi:hypothetical protein [Nanobdella aerobiophila]|nr:hypothetical protein [Nanobdella aerobiophila]
MDEETKENIIDAVNNIIYGFKILFFIPIIIIMIYLFIFIIPNIIYLINTYIYILYLDNFFEFYIMVIILYLIGILLYALSIYEFSKGFESINNIKDINIKYLFKIINISIILSLTVILSPLLSISNILLGNKLRLIGKLFNNKNIIIYSKYFIISSTSGILSIIYFLNIADILKSIFGIFGLLLAIILLYSINKLHNEFQRYIV